MSYYIVLQYNIHGNFKMVFPQHIVYPVYNIFIFFLSTNGLKSKHR